jgi:hypothetical protein
MAGANDMGRPDERLERQITTFASEVAASLGDRLVCLALHGSAAGDDYVDARSDVNSVVVLRKVTMECLEALSPVVARWERRRFGIPLVLDEDFIARGADTFPMELEDIRRQHRLLSGSDVLKDIHIEPLALRRQCEQEARGKLLRLRALYLSTSGAPSALERLMLDSLKSILILLRHLIRLRGEDIGQSYTDALTHGTALLGPLPLMQSLLDHRRGVTRLVPRGLHAEFRAYLDEVERIVGALDALGA